MANFKGPRIANSARYQIRVTGHLDSSWSGRLGGLTISTSVQDDGSAVTSLTGELMDQAALLGTLNTLASLQYPILSVCYLSKEEAL